MMRLRGEIVAAVEAAYLLTAFTMTRRYLVRWADQRHEFYGGRDVVDAIAVPTWWQLVVFGPPLLLTAL